MTDKKEKLDALTRLSRRYGADTAFIVAGGGNTSVKVGGTLFIKPSGVFLAQIGPDTFIPMDREKIRAIFSKTANDDPTIREEAAKADLAAARCDLASTARPSVETPMHEALDSTFVIHTHPNRVNGLTCSVDGAAKAAKLFPNDMLWIPFVDPGHTLAMRIHSELAAYKKKHGAHPKIILLENHGLIVGGDTEQEIIDRTDRVLKQLQDQKQPSEPFGAPTGASFLEGDPLDELLLAVMPALRRLLSTQERRLVRFDRSPEVQELLGGKEGRAQATSGTFTPDHIVYCKEKPVWVPFDPATDDAVALEERIEQAVIAFRTAEDYVPKIVLVESVGLFASDTTSASTQNALDLYRDWIRVARHCAAFGEPKFMSQRNVDFIDHWEVEAYRRRQAKLQPLDGRPNPLELDPNWAEELAHKVILVTGAGAGVGRVVAQACDFMGGYPVCADLHADALKATTEELQGGLGVVADITDEASVRAAFVAAVKQYGGVDGVVNIPSISPSGPLETMDVAVYEQTLKVGLLGYAIVGKYAAKVMKKQRWGAGVSLTSKSGLFPSVENNAYAATKGGEINQGHSFAAELGPFGIRWNNLALGNVFAVGSTLWSDEQCQARAKKKGIAFADAADCREKIRAYYNAQNALGSEVTPPDIAYAIGFMLSDKARVMTGHTMLLDGGQTYH